MTNRVKIAILDTGIDERQVGFSSRRSLIRDDREKEDPNTNGDPVKAIKSFVQGRTATDVNGHGTHIADILLRIAPRADLFIAKISHGLSVETTDQIADVNSPISSHLHLMFQVDPTLGDRLGGRPGMQYNKHVLRPHRRVHHCRELRAN